MGVGCGTVWCEWVVGVYSVSGLWEWVVGVEDCRIYILGTTVSCGIIDLEEYYVH